jgi:hypothetical protein
MHIDQYFTFSTANTFTVLAKANGQGHFAKVKLSISVSPKYL